MFTISYTTSEATSHTMFDCFALGTRLVAFRACIQAAFKFGNAMIYCSAQHTNQSHQSSCRDGRSRRGVRRRRLSTAGRMRWRTSCPRQEQHRQCWAPATVTRQAPARLWKLWSRGNRGVCRTLPSSLQCTCGIPCTGSPCSVQGPARGRGGGGEGRGEPFSRGGGRAIMSRTT